MCSVKGTFINSKGLLLILLWEVAANIEQVIHAIVKGWLAKEG